MTGLLLSHHLLVLLLAGIALSLAVLFYFWKKHLLANYESLRSGRSICPGPENCVKKIWSKDVYDSEKPERNLNQATSALDDSHLALQESEAYLRMLYNNILDPAFLIDFDTKLIVDSNQAARNFYGYTEQEFSQMTPDDLLFEKLEKDESSETSKKIQKDETNEKSKPSSILVTAEQVRIEKQQHYKKDGTPAWIEVQQSYFERQGKKFNILNLQDITEQVTIQEAFEKNYRRLVEAQEIAKIGNWEFHIDSRKFWASDEAHRIFGHMPDADGFVPWSDVLEHLENSRNVMQAYHEFLAGKLDMISVSHEIQTHDDIRRSIEIIVKLARDDKKKPLMLFGTVEDVTERRDLERQLQADAQREAFLARCLRLMLKSSNVDKTIKRIISEVGEHFQADEVVIFQGTTEIDESALAYRWCNTDPTSEDTTPRTGSKSLKRWLDQLVQGLVVVRTLDEIPNREVQNFMRGLGFRAFLASPILLRRKMWGRLGVGYSAEKPNLGERDASLLETLTRIISLGIERSQRETALRDERNKAELASQAKSEFLANMSHEIRTPMTAILGFADILASSRDEREKEDAVQTIRKNGQFLLKVINDILDFSKIEAHRVDLEIKEVNLLRFLSEIESMISVSAKEKGIEFCLECPTPIPETIETDALRLRQILVNLLGNAVKFTAKGHVSIGTEVIEKNGSPRLRFQVSDTGIGISQDQLPCLFKPFTQADSSVTRRFGGTGLGLTISARLAELLGGSIQVMSKEGIGSVFTVDIDPRKTGPLVKYHKISIDEAGSPMHLDATSLNHLNVLLVEDGLDNQRLVSLLLRKAGATVTIAENGQVACDIVDLAARKSTQFDVILMDMQMPVMDGYTATRRIRQSGYKMPIFALTAHAMEHDRQKCLDAGCDDYISKPIKVKELINRIASIRPTHSKTC